VAIPDRLADRPASDDLSPPRGRWRTPLVFYLGQLGKYVPGTIWPVVTQMRLGRDYRVPPRTSGAAFAVFMLLLVGTGLLVGSR
jgi:glycosyltransferase 2 family protein